MRSWFAWLRGGYVERPQSFLGFCDARQNGQRCVKVWGHEPEHDFGGRGLLQYSETQNSTRMVPAQALVDALAPPEES